MIAISEFTTILAASIWILYADNGQGVEHPHQPKQE